VSTFTTNDDTQIYDNGWGAGQPVILSPSWPLSADVGQALTSGAIDRIASALAAAGVERIYGFVGDRLNGFANALQRRGGAELSVLIEALAQRAVHASETKLCVGPLELDLTERTAKRGDRSIELLPREFRLLEYMMRREGQVLTREMLLREVWKYKFVPETNLLDVHIGRLRRKIDGPHDPAMILTVRGKGFLLRIEEGQSEFRQAS
jgi:DNA-binding winged helix-turn-helix (wHTH) protein